MKKATSQSKTKTQTTEAETPSNSVRNAPLHIPLDFDKAVEALSNIKPKKKLDTNEQA